MQRKIAFMGTPNFAVPILKYIYQNGYEIPVVYTQPPKKTNRGQKIEKSPKQPQYIKTIRGKGYMLICKEI